MSSRIEDELSFHKDSDRDDRKGCQSISCIEGRFQLFQLH